MAGGGLEEMTVVPRSAVRFPLPMPTPEGFVVSEPSRWPAVAGRLEYVEGRLLFMPPCGDEQQQTAVDVVTELNLWRRAHPDFVVGGNEAGMLLGGEVRAADAAVWRRVDVGDATGGFPRVAPLLAVEVAGQDERTVDLAEKARWYLAHGVLVVWILDPRARTVAVLEGGTRQDLGLGGAIPAHAALPGLAPRVDDLFRQVTGG